MWDGFWFRRLLHLYSAFWQESLMVASLKSITLVVHKGNFFVHYRRDTIALPKIWVSIFIFKSRHQYSKILHFPTNIRDDNILQLGR